jgi:hypothetical protein
VRMKSREYMRFLAHAFRALDGDPPSAISRALHRRAPDIVRKACEVLTLDEIRNGVAPLGIRTDECRLLSEHLKKR